MFRKTYELTLSSLFLTSAVAFLFATALFLAVGVGHIIEHPKGTINNMLVALFMIGVTGLLLSGTYRFSRSLIDQDGGVAFEKRGSETNGGKVVQIKRDQSVAAD
ncbi:MAG: hypothetical protein ACE5FY_08210 [Nitrospiria bacterium]